MDGIFNFDKSFAERYQEYCNVFDGTILPASHMKLHWSYYLELAMDIIGWQAVWKISRLTCESLKISFPSFVLVVVLDIDFKELKGIVRVLAVQDDIMIPEMHHVPLIQLWPTKSQDTSVALNMEATADALDMLRFFYLHLFMPWDLEEDDSVDWKANHLETRLRLYYDMKNGVIPHASAEYIHSLLAEARRLQNKREVIESTLRESDEDQIAEYHPKLEEKLMEIHVKLMEIHTEIDILENPLLRKVKMNKYFDSIANRSSKEQIWVIFDSGSADDYIHFLQNVKKYYPTQTLKFSTELASMLETANTGDVFILNESQHPIRSSGTLEREGVVRGIGSRDKIVITTNTDDVMLDLGHTLIENVTIDAFSPQCAMLVRRGKCTLKNCKIIGDSNASTHQGIIVLSGTELELVDCELSGFSAAIVGNSGAVITMRNCSVHSVEVGIKLFDKCKVEMDKVDFKNCNKNAVLLETDGRIDESKENLVGSFDILKTIPEIIMDSVVGSNNCEGDVAIIQRNKLKPVEDLFSNPDLDPSIIVW